ncbi:MATE family efflux transporter [Sutterella wadsworthensis]|uniref:MATE family efflux transporter n=1 Tax=Sutterella wadsworthensis TaxID=40545 RepID=UPI00266B9292|nr:MATE family efflux transporter [Sutterella wadsworthensis]
MLSGSIWDKMILFALPLAFTGVLQQLYNAADVAVLGHFVSDGAMAAVGNNVPIIGLIVSLCMGLALGANVVVAQALGMRDEERASRGVHTAFYVAVVFGVVMAIAGEIGADWIIACLEVPESVRADSELYLRVYLLGMPFIAVYNFLAAVYRSQGDTQTPLWALCFATVLANALAAGILFWRECRMTGPLRLELRRLLKPDAVSLRSIIRIGWPAGVQGAVFSFSNLIIQAAINSLGADVMAGSVAAFTIEINVYCFINAFGLAATTFVSQNYGAGNLGRCRRATWVSMGLNFCASVMMIAVVLIFERSILGLFTHSEAVMEIAITRILLVVLAEPISVVMETVSDAMRGYGYSMPPAMVTLFCICSIRIVWVYTVFAADPTFDTLMIVYPISWAVTTLALTWLYFRHQKMLTAKHAHSRATSPEALPFTD